MSINIDDVKKEIAKHSHNSTVEKFILDSEVKSICTDNSELQKSYWAYRFDKQSNYMSHRQWLLYTHGILSLV